MVTCLECDPEHSERIYLLDNYSNVFRIYENSDGKTVVQQAGNLTAHSLDEELRDLKNLPWATICISQRAIKFETYCFSMNTQFYWKIN